LIGVEILPSQNQMNGATALEKQCAPQQPPSSSACSRPELIGIASASRTLHVRGRWDPDRVPGMSKKRAKPVYGEEGPQEGKEVQAWCSLARTMNRAISRRGVRMSQRKSYLLVRLCAKRYGNVRSRSPALSTAFHKYGRAFLRMLTGQPRPLGRALSLVGQASCLSKMTGETPVPPKP